MTSIDQSQVIKTEAEHTSELLDTETEESGEESEAGDTERLKTEAEGGKEASTSKPPYSYVAMIGEARTIEIQSGPSKRS